MTLDPNRAACTRAEETWRHRLLFDDGVVRDVQHVPGEATGSLVEPSMVRSTSLGFGLTRRLWRGAAVS